MKAGEMRGVSGVSIAGECFYLPQWFVEPVEKPSEEWERVDKGRRKKKTRPPGMKSRLNPYAQAFVPREFVPRTPIQYYHWHPTPPWPVPLPSRGPLPHSLADMLHHTGFR